MANFKLAKKDALSDTRSNIYDLHDRKLDFFESEKKNINNYINELNKCNKEFLSLKKNNYNNKLKDRIHFLEEKIYNIDNDIDQTQYLLEFVSILNNNTENNGNNGKNDKVSIPDELVQIYKNTNNTNMDIFVNSKINNTKIELYNEYVRAFNPDLKQIHIQNDVKQICINCKCEVFRFDAKTATEICMSCGLTNYIIGNDDIGPVYTDTSEQVTVFNYKRNNHFQECLNQLQAKENTSIPPKIIEELTAEFKKYNITDPKLFNITLVKSYLKKLKYNKYYEHIPTIINEFCGLRAPKMTSELEQQLKIMFDEIQTPFEKHSKIICPMRKNFLNYNYIFYKMCELLNKDEFLICFPLLKSREKLYEHDLIWKGICNDLRWEYIPSI